jgi:hypothetical protein
LVEPFIQKPIRVSGTVGDIVAMNGGVAVYITISGHVLSATFSSAWEDRLAEPDKGDEIALMGRIEAIGMGGFHLGDCELIEERRSNPASPTSP